ncbi:hypothetical protein BS78_01G242200 [Paspalum vaginatum]|nr:hypothetical protein BS78_01G242200 [Paspalum vaginatum]
MNELEGTLPSNLDNGLSKIQYLILAVNHFKGHIPASIANATTLQSIDLSENYFAGIVPPEIGTLCLTRLTNPECTHDWKFITLLTDCSILRGVTLENNRFSGVFPSSIANLSAQLGILDIRHNEISGRIPDGIASLTKLYKLGLAGNQFTGHIPESIGRLKMLQFLALENNQWSGAMPSSLGNLTQLQHLSVDNILEGPLPVSLGNLQQLVIATLSKSNNALSVVPFRPKLVLSRSSRTCTCKEITYLEFCQILSNCQSLMELRLDYNCFSGIIPTSISQMRDLVLLNLAKNNITGIIPQELGLMNGLKELYLAQNYITGEIPETMERMTSLYRLDISFNHLDGQVPVNGVFNNLTGLSLNGNDKLCGGIEELHLPQCPTKAVEHNQRTLRVVRNAMSVTAVIIVVCFIILTLLFLFSKKALIPSSKIVMVDPLLMDDMYPRLSYSDLSRGTNGFSANNLIGMGKYGSVYKGTIVLKGLVTTVAMKVFDLEQPGSSKCFVTECKALCRIRHRNLIHVITCCSCSDLKQNEFKALVLEFMPYGSLDRWLHPDVHSSYPVSVLTLVQRLNIAADVATALDYLHNNCQPSIVHCDVKPRNILLGDDVVAHVVNFGLTKILSDPVGEQPINSRSSVRVLGTIGYVPPEYGECGQISLYGDVYSFGIVLLELFTGKARTHDMFIDVLTLLKYAEMAYPARLMEIVDPLLLYAEFEPGAINGVMDSVIRLALSCSKNRPAERLHIRDIVDEIQKIRASDPTLHTMNETHENWARV